MNNYAQLQKYRHIYAYIALEDGECEFRDYGPAPNFEEEIIGVNFKKGDLLYIGQTSLGTKADFNHRNARKLYGNANGKDLRCMTRIRTFLEEYGDLVEFKILDTQKCTQMMIECAERFAINYFKPILNQNYDPVKTSQANKIY